MQSISFCRYQLCLGILFGLVLIIYHFVTILILTLMLVIDTEIVVYRC